MSTNIFFTARAVLAAIFLILLNACVYGVPIVSPVDVVLIAGAGGGFTGENTELYWPFERDSEVLEFKCEELPARIELTSRTALVTIPGRKMRLTRSSDTENRQRLAYWDATRIDVVDIGLLASESGQDLEEFIFNRLVVLDAQSAELDLDAKLLLCRDE